MQLPSSTSVSDPSLAALPQPAPLSGASGEFAADAPGNAGGFEALIANLAPSAASRSGPPVASNAPARVPARAGLAAKPVSHGASGAASVAPAPLGCAAVVSFFGADAPVAASAPDTLNERTETFNSEERDSARPDAALVSPEVLPSRIEPPPPLALVSCALNPAGDEGETAATDTPLSAESSANGRGNFARGSLPSMKGGYSQSGDETPIAETMTTGSSGTEIVDVAGARGRSDVSGRATRALEAATDLSQTARPTGIDRAVSAATVALAGPAGEVAAGVPFTGSHKSTTSATNALTSAAPNEKGLALRAVRAAAAKFAGVEAEGTVDRFAVSKRPDKTFLTSEEESVVNESKQLGTAIANLETSMISRFSSNAPSHPGTEYPGEGVTAAAGGDLAAKETAAVDAPVSTAHEAVEAVLNAADRMTAREQRSVDLNFTVGDASLAVRVELHGEEVRTSFRTDSPELQAALAEEWDARGAGGDKTLRFAAPVITGSDSAGTNDSSGRSPQQQERQARHVDFESAFVRREPARVETAAIPVLAPTTPSPRTSHRLLSFA